MEAIDALNDALDGVEKGQDPPANLSALAGRLRLPSAAAATAVAELPATKPAAEGASFARRASDPPGLSRGLLYNIEITLQATVEMPAARAMIVYKRLENLGQIRACSPRKESISSGKFDGRLTVQLSSTCTEDTLRNELKAIPEIDTGVLAPEATPNEGTPDPLTRTVPASMSKPAGGTVRIATDSLDRFLDHLGELIIHESRLENALRPGPDGVAARALANLRKTLERLHADLMSLRMVPFEHIAARFLRSARNLGGNLGKRVMLSIHGRDVRLDRSILEDLVDPINHILRNAVDHGIETPDERVSLGKDPVGKIIIRNTEHSDSVTVEIEDDGRGMDPERIRRAAVERKFMTNDEARALGDAEVLMLVTTPGFSTAERLTRVSGRGVGMDVVRTRIETLGGRLRMTSTPGEGTRITLHLPLTIAVIHAFLVRSGEQQYAVPVGRVQRTVEVPRSQVRTVGGLPVVRLGDETVHLIYLRELANGGDLAEELDASPALLYDLDGQPTGLVVDAVLAKRDIVVKPLHSPLENLREFSGATVLEDGRIALILDVLNLTT